MIRLCAPTDEAGYFIDDAITRMLKHNIMLAEIRDIDGINVLEMNEEQAQNFYDKLQNAGIDVWSISSPVGKRDFKITIDEFEHRVQKAVKAAKYFHTNNIRFFSFFDHGNNLEAVAKRMQLCVDIAAQNNINAILENEKDSYAETAETTKALLDAVPELKYVYDSSNFIQVGEPADKTLDELFARAYFVHFKDGVHAHGDADICPVGKGEAKIDKMLNLIDRDIVLSLEHHLLFATDDYPAEAGNPHPYSEIEGTCPYVYKSIADAFDDACVNAKIMLENAGYKETKKGVYEK